MKKSVLSLAAIVVLSASTLTASAQMTSQARSGSDPRPQARSGSDPRPQSVAGTIYTTVLAYFGF